MLLHNIPFIRIMLLAAITKVLYFLWDIFPTFVKNYGKENNIVDSP